MSTMVAAQPETTPKAEITPDELLAMPDGGHFELIETVDLHVSSDECESAEIPKFI